MFTLIFLVAAVLSFVCYKTKRTYLFRLFLAVSIGMIAIIAVVVLIESLFFNYNSTDLQDYRQKLETVQEEMRQVKKELIEADSLDNETLDEFLENYQELKNKEQEYEIVIEEMNDWLGKGGGKENVEYCLFFNLF